MTTRASTTRSPWWKSFTQGSVGHVSLRTFLKMWSRIASAILRYRVLLLVVLTAITAFMAYEGSKIELSYQFSRAIPSNHPRYIEYEDYKKTFGEDGNLMVIALQPKDIFNLDFFQRWYDLSDSIKAIEGVTAVLSIPEAYYPYKDTTTNKANLAQLFSKRPESQRELDSLRNMFIQLPFYNDILYNGKTNATLLGVTIKPQTLNSKDRTRVVQQIQGATERIMGNGFGEIRYSGLPLIRTIMATQVQHELNKFLLLSVIVTALVLLILLRSIYAVFFSLIVVGIAVVWTMGTIVLLGFKITLLTGLIPPLVVVIGITNCVYLLNKYHIELSRGFDKTQALHRMIERVGLATLFTNLTAAIGFGVFYFTKSQVLKEFGLVAGLNVSALFVISIIVIPCVFSLLPLPKAIQMKYLEFKSLNKVLDVFDGWVHNFRPAIYAVTALVVVVAIVGTMRLKATGFIVDDIPHGDKLYTDLKFFETNFHGVMPLDILIKGKDKNAIKKNGVLSKMNALQDTLATYKEFSKSLSIVEAIKFANQANAGGDSSAYRLASRSSLGGVDQNAVVLSYLQKLKDKRIIAPFIDSTAQTARISLNMADIGSEQMHRVINGLEPKIYNTIDTSKYKVTLTGTSIIFLEGLQFIIDGLFESLLLAFLLIAVCMGYLFRSLKMIFFSLLPNLVPLLVTAGLMGYFNIPLKPSTVLIYSIAFGIAIDNAIRFLAKYQQELHRHKMDVSKTVSLALHEAGISIIYTSIILFFGFIIFTASNFGGTFYLGLLTSITLVVAMFNNLLLLPSMLLSLERWSNRKNFKDVTPADTLAEAEVEIEDINEQVNTNGSPLKPH